MLATSSMWGMVACLEQREHSLPKFGVMRDTMTRAMGSPGVYRRI
jgi:hypothetical protein